MATLSNSMDSTLQNSPTPQALPLLGKRGLEVAASDASDDDDELFCTDPDSDLDADGDLHGACQYDLSNERKPSFAAYDDNFQQVHYDLASIAEQVENEILQSGCDNPRVAGNLRKATAMQDQPAIKKKHIILVGKSGAGKSSLINAGLDIPYIAKAVSMLWLCHWQVC
jgi:hypothetical protein